jgi:hypothetical protein
MQIKTKFASCHTADSKPVKQEVNGAVILPTLVFTSRGYVTITKGSTQFLGLSWSFFKITEYKPVAVQRPYF